MLLFQRSTAALTGVFLLAASLSAGVHSASAQEVQPTAVATQESTASAEPSEAATPAPVEEAPVTATAVEPAPSEDVHAEETHAAEAPAGLEELFAGGIPNHPDHTYEGRTSTDGRSLDSTTEGAAMSPLGAGGTLSRAGDIKVRLVTLDLADSTATVPMTVAENAIGVSSTYWKSMSNGRLSMSVASRVTNFKTTAKSTDTYDQIMNKVTAELKWSYSPYTALVVFTPKALKEGYLGYGWSSSGTSGRILMPYTSELANFTTNVVTHEFGHVLGLMHSDSLECASGQPDTASFSGTGCSIRHYGDTSDLMGISRWFDTPAISSSFWDYGGFGRGDEILNVGVASGSKTYTLRPWAGTASNRAVKFTDPRSNEVYYLELRVPVGFDRNTATNGNRGVKVVQSGGLTTASSLLLMPSSKPYSGYYATNTAWQAGSTFMTHAGTAVRINSVSDSAASVTIDTNPFPASSLSDMNSDGVPDVVARDASGQLWLYPTTSTGALGTRTLIGSGWGGMTSIVLPGDFNGDGFADILARDSGGRLWLYAGTGTGTVRSGVQIGSGWKGMTELITPGDFDGDRNVDVLARDGAGALFLYSGNGAGGWKSSSQPGSGWQVMTAILSPGDFDGDRKSDIIARDSAGNLYLYAGNGTGGFAPRRQIGTGWNAMNAIVGSGDYNGDGKVDLLARDSGGALWLYKGNGAGGFEGKVAAGSGWNNLLIASVTVQAAAEAPVETAPVEPEPVAPQPTERNGRTDMNGDGYPDIVARDSTGGLWLYPSTATGTFGRKVQLGSGWGGMNMILLPGDFNGDGISDILARDSGGRLWLYTGTGTGTVKAGVQIGNGWGIMTALVTPGDFDGDGHPDLLARTGDGALYIYPGNGKGGWGSKAQIGTGWGGMTALLSTGDFNGDGTSDLLARNSEGALYLYAGNGKGGFLGRSQPGAGWNSMTGFVGPGPWGADSNADLIARNSKGDLFLYSGDGAGRFSGARQIGQGWQGMYLAE